MRHLVFVAVGLMVWRLTGRRSPRMWKRARSRSAECAPCHNIGPDATNKVGPELNGINGRKSGTVAGFNYSDANKGSGITWNEEVFKEYIKDRAARCRAPR